MFLPFLGAQFSYRNMVLASSRVPETVPGTSVDRQCGSSQQAIHFAAQARPHRRAPLPFPVHILSL